MTTLKKILFGIIALLLIPVVYIVVSLLLTTITIDNTSNTTEPKKLIYLNTNGVHLDIVIPKNIVESHLLEGIKHNPEDEFLSFGWGDENFYINTPTWGDLTFSTAVEAMLLNSTTLMHVTRYKNIQTNWVKVEVSKLQLQKLNAYIQNAFQTDRTGNKIIFENESYSTNDEFYKAKGSYTCFNTCNTWANTAFKESGLKSCLWTPFDFGLINKYE
jgi:uncharacterized protein (TIGR02117 family)